MMLKYLLLCCTLTAHAIWAKPVQPDLASHIVIVTPQAQVHLEPAFKYDTSAGTTFIHHLSPLARIGAPAHEETIVYVPTSAAGGASLIPFGSGHATVVGRSSSSGELEQQNQAKQYDQISQQIEQIQTAIQSGSSMLGPQLSEAASAAASAASSAGTGLFPALFPPPNLNKDAEKLKIEKIIYETPASTEPLLPRFYALTPAVSHIVDFGHAPVFVGPLSAIRTRSIQEGEALPPSPVAIAEPAAAVPLPLPLPKAETLLPLKTTIKEEEKKPIKIEEPLEKKYDSPRFLEANVLKEDKKKEILDEINTEKLKGDQNIATSNIIAAAAQPVPEIIADYTQGQAI